MVNLTTSRNLIEAFDDFSYTEPEFTVVRELFWYNK